MSVWKREITKYGTWLATQSYADKTRSRRACHLGHFSAWCRERGWDPRDLRFQELEAYQAHLVGKGGVSGRGLHPHTVKDYLVTLKGFFDWLVRSQRIMANPAKDLILPKKRKRLPRTLSEAEIERVLRQVDVDTDEGVRDRAIMEVFYATGMRASELAKLTVQDLDLRRGLVWIRQGKGAKDRWAPLTERAEAWLERYLIEVRESWGFDLGFLFVRAQGKPFKNTHLAKLVKVYLRQAAKEKSLCRD